MKPLLIIFTALAFSLLTGSCNDAQADPADEWENTWDWQDKYAEVSTGDTRLHLFLPRNTTETLTPLIVVLPGGGYSNHTPNEGLPWVSFCTEAGYAVAVLEYELPHGNPERTVNHVKSTISYLRQEAAFRIDPDHIGVMGFSAGAHLASLIATQPDVAARPAFQVLFYPVISMEDEYVTTTIHSNCRSNLLGPEPTDELKREYSSNLRVDEDAPAAFIAVGNKDTIVDISNSYSYESALTQNGVEAVVMIAPDGEHGHAGWANRTHILNTLKAWLVQRLAGDDEAEL